MINDLCHLSWKKVFFSFLIFFSLLHTSFGLPPLLSRRFLFAYELVFFFSLRFAALAKNEKSELLILFLGSVLFFMSAGPFFALPSWGWHRKLRVRSRCRYGNFPFFLSLLLLFYKPSLLSKILMQEKKKKTTPSWGGKRERERKSPSSLGMKFTTRILRGSSVQLVNDRYL